MIIPLDAYTGIIPKDDATKLPPNAATVAVDCDFTSGKISGLNLSSVTDIASGPSGFVYNGDAQVLYALPYDASFARGPVQQDSHQRFYWTASNGGVTEFKFARVGDNAAGGVPAVSYKVGVAEFLPNTLQFNGAYDLAGTAVAGKDTAVCVGGFVEVPRFPTVVLADSALSATGTQAAITAGKLYLADANNALIKDITNDVVGFVGVGTKYNGWYVQYDMTLSKDPASYGLSTVSGTSMTSGSGQVSIAGTGISNQNATVWFTVSSGANVPTWCVLTSGAAIDTTATPVGTQVVVDAYIDGVPVGNAVMYVRSESILGASSSDAIPSELTTPTSAPPVADTHICVVLDLTYNGVTYSAQFHAGQSLRGAWYDNSGLNGTLTKTGVATKYSLVMQFGYDTGAENAAWLMTFVNQLGEESAPFTPCETSVSSGYRMAAFYINKSALSRKMATAFAGRYPVHGIRFYKTASGSSASENFYYVGTVKVGGGSLQGETYFDTSLDNATNYYAINSQPNTALGAPCKTTNFIADVAELQKLQGLTTLYNGILAAFKGNEVWYCEPYQPWCWRRSYVHTLPHKVVSLLPQEQGVYILTERYPYYASGASPDSMMPTRIPSQFPCLNRQSAVTINGMAVYLSPDGPVFLDGANARLDTMAFSRESWRRSWEAGLTSDGEIRLAAYGSRLIAYFPSPTTAVTGYLYDMTTQGWTTLTEPIKFAFTVPPGMFGQHADNLAIYSGSGNWKLLGGDATQTKAWEWRSKDFVMAYPTNFGVIQLFGVGSVLLTVFADGVQVHQQTVALSDRGTLVRLPAGFLASKWAYSIKAQSSGVVLRASPMAQTISELKNV